MTTLLLDVDGVLQFSNDQRPSDDLDAAFNVGVRWRAGYDAFLADVFTDHAYLATMSGRGAVLPALQHVLDRHTTDVSATEVHACGAPASSSTRTCWACCRGWSSTPSGWPPTRTRAARRWAALEFVGAPTWATSPAGLLVG